MKEIVLSGGEITFVDDWDFEKLNRHNWYCHKGYAVRKGANRSYIAMHRVVLGTPSDRDTDHINRNRLDNRRENLRACTESENQHNTEKPKHNTSGYKGVYWRKDQNKWIAKIKFQKKEIHIGCFGDFVSAVIAYNRVALRLHGEFAYLNEI